LRTPPSGPPVITRIAGDHLVLDLRTVSSDEQTALASALTAALGRRT